MQHVCGIEGDNDVYVNMSNLTFIEPLKILLMEMVVCKCTVKQPFFRFLLSLKVYIIDPPTLDRSASGLSAATPVKTLKITFGSRRQSRSSEIDK